MAQVGSIIMYIIMAFVVIGVIGAIIRPERGIGKEFLDGVYTIGPIFIPVAGIMASVPYLASFIEGFIAPSLRGIGADPAIASSLIAVDMGGYQLAEATADSQSGWILASLLGFTLGATLVFFIPVGMAMLPRRDHRYLGLGIMCGILTVPLSAFLTILILKTGVLLRPEVSFDADSTWRFDIGWTELFLGLAPVMVIVIAIALGLRFAPSATLKTFMWFGRGVDTFAKIVFALSIVEYFTGVFSSIWSGWGFDPIIADEVDQFRALEVAGYVGIILAGAFPMVYVLRTYCSKPIGAVGRRVGLSADATTALVAAIANVMALFRVIPTLRPRDKVIAIAFMVCGTDALGGHLAYAANVQPNMLVPLIIGKILAGVVAIFFARWLAFPMADKLAEQDLHDEPGLMTTNQQSS